MKTADLMPKATAIPTVREVPARDLQPGMRLEWGAPWQPAVHSIKTYGPGKDESPSYPENWWTRITVEYADGSLVGHYYRPSDPVRVVSEVACRGCHNLVPVADLAVGRKLDHTVYPPRFIGRYHLCPACAENGA